MLFIKPRSIYNYMRLRQPVYRSSSTGTLPYHQTEPKYKLTASQYRYAQTIMLTTVDQFFSLIHCNNFCGLKKNCVFLDTYGFAKFSLKSIGNSFFLKHFVFINKIHEKIGIKQMIMKPQQPLNISTLLCKQDLPVKN